VSDSVRPDRDCPDPGLLAGYAEDRLLPRERAFVEAHLVRCDDCRGVVVGMPPVRRPAFLRPWMALIPVAAALLLFLLPATPAPGTEVALASAAKEFGFRPLDHAERLAPALLPKRGGALPLLRPAGKVLEPRPEFRWERVPAVAAWTVSLSTADGTLLWSEKAAGDRLPFPATREALRPGARYLVEVRGEGPLGTETARRVFAVASEKERTDYETTFKAIDTRAPAALRPLLEAHLALRAGLAAVAAAPARAAVTASPSDAVARETLDRILEDLGEAP
jgi:hypothetical protein